MPAAAAKNSAPAGSRGGAVISAAHLRCGWHRARGRPLPQRALRLHDKTCNHSRKEPCGIPAAAGEGEHAPGLHREMRRCALRFRSGRSPWAGRYRSGAADGLFHGVRHFFGRIALTAERRLPAIFYRNDAKISRRFFAGSRAGRSPPQGFYILYIICSYNLGRITNMAGGGGEKVRPVCRCTAARIGGIL